MSAAVMLLGFFLADELYRQEIQAEHYQLILDITITHPELISGIDANGDGVISYYEYNSFIDTFKEKIGK